MFVNVMQNQGLLSPREAHRAIWGATANWKGGASKNVETDLMQEHRNRDHKQLIASMGANKTHTAIARPTKASGCVRTIVENYDKESNVPQQSTAHLRRSSLKDESVILRDLRQLKLFENINGRKHASFPDISGNPLHVLKPTEIRNWFQKHLLNISLFERC